MFQSTPLLRGATATLVTMGSPEVFQSTPLLRGATRQCQQLERVQLVSIHAPLARGDGMRLPLPCRASGFNPRPSCEGRQLFFQFDDFIVYVSIHAPLARGDFISSSLCCDTVFQSTPLLRGATSDSHISYTGSQFQSTPLLRGATVRDLVVFPSFLCFNPRPSCEGRLYWSGLSVFTICFNPRPSCEGRPIALSLSP